MISYLPIFLHRPWLSVWKNLRSANSQKDTLVDNWMGVLEFCHFGIMFIDSVNRTITIRWQLVMGTVRFIYDICDGRLALCFHCTRLTIRLTSIFNKQLCDVIQITSLCLGHNTDYKNNCQRTEYGIHPKRSRRCNDLFRMWRRNTRLICWIRHVTFKLMWNWKYTPLLSSDTFWWR